MDAFLPPVSATAAVRCRAVLVAATNADASVQAPVGLTVEGSAVGRSDPTDLVGGPVTNQGATSLLEEVGVTGVEADTTGGARALAVGVARGAAGGDPLVVVRGWVQGPLTCTELIGAWVSGTGVAAVVGIT